MLLSMLKDRQGSGWYTATYTEGEMGWGGGGGGGSSTVLQYEASSAVLF